MLLLLSFALIGTALLVAPGYRREIVRGYGAGLVVAGALALAVSAWVGDWLVDSLAQTAATEPAIRGVWDVYDSLLAEAATATIGYGLVVLAATWLGGRTRWAVATRRALAPYLREPAIAYGVLAAIVLVVIVWWAPTPATRNPVTALVLAALLVLGLALLRRQTAREWPAETVSEPAPPVPAESVGTR